MNGFEIGLESGLATGFETGFETDSESELVIVFVKRFVPQTEILFCPSSSSLNARERTQGRTIVLLRLFSDPNKKDGTRNKDSYHYHIRSSLHTRLVDKCKTTRLRPHHRSGPSRE